MIGFEIKTETGQLLNSTRIEVWADDEEEALEKAAKLIKKPNYVVSAVIEQRFTKKVPKATIKA